MTSKTSLVVMQTERRRLVLLLIDQHSRALRATRPKPLTRWRAVVTSNRLDRRLAQGGLPEESELLALHAALITSPRACAELAVTLSRILELAEGVSRPSMHSVPICRNSVLSASNDLQVVVERLTRGPARALGVARLRLLLSDGAGPLFRPLDQWQLRRSLQAVLRDI